MLIFLFLSYIILLAGGVVLMRRNEYVGRVRKEMIDEFYQYIIEYYIPEYYSKKRTIPYTRFDFDNYSYSYEHILYRMFYIYDKTQFWKADFREDIKAFLARSEYLEP